MPSLETAEHPLVTALQDAFGIQVSEGTVDVVVVEEDAEQDACEVQADDWTLFIEGWPVHQAWIALDTDVDSPEQLRTALEGALSEDDIRSLGNLNGALAGDLNRALIDSGDELSIALAALIDSDVENAEDSSSTS
jgi:hypothetical protein